MLQFHLTGLTGFYIGGVIVYFQLCVSYPYVIVFFFNCGRQYPFLGMIMFKLCFDRWTPCKKHFIFEKVRITVFVAEVPKRSYFQLSLRSQIQPQGEIWTLSINRTTLLLSLEDTFKEISRLVELT